jgi:hypothetical protein
VDRKWWLSLREDDRPHRLSCMGRYERGVFRRFPEFITIYRGFLLRPWRRSWSARAWLLVALSRAKADAFARRCPIHEHR